MWVKAWQGEDTKMRQTSKRFVGEEEGEGRAFRPGSRPDTCGRREGRQEVWIWESQTAVQFQERFGQVLKPKESHTLGCPLLRSVTDSSLQAVWPQCKHGDGLRGDSSLRLSVSYAPCSTRYEPAHFHGCHIHTKQNVEPSIGAQLCSRY